MSNETGAQLTKAKIQEYLNVIYTIYARHRYPSYSLQEMPILTAKLDALLATYPTIAEQMGNYLRPLLSRTNYGASSRPQPIILIGASGVGKTALLLKIGEILGIYVQRLTKHDLLSKGINYDVPHIFFTES